MVCAGVCLLLSQVGTDSSREVSTGTIDRVCILGSTTWIFPQQFQRRNHFVVDEAVVRQAFMHKLGVLPTRKSSRHEALCCYCEVRSSYAVGIGHCAQCCDAAPGLIISVWMW
jgi:hypothetical protein